MEYPTEWAMPSSAEEDNGQPELHLGVSTVDAAVREEPAEKVIGFAPASGATPGREPLRGSYA
jgi:hypothetical protein